MNKPLRHIAIFCGLLVLALLLRDNWLQFVRSDELNSHPKNQRTAIERYSYPRGDIIVDGKPITGSAESDDSMYKYRRTYVDGPLWAPVTGYASSVFGSDKLEKIYDPILTGNDDRLFFDRTLSMFTGETKKGGNVVTTLNAAAQKAAYEGLGDKKGAVAAIDPQTGKILALASTPSYDPGQHRGAFERRRQGVERDPEGPRQAVPEPAAARDLPSRFHVQGGHGGRRDRGGHRQGHQRADGHALSRT